MVKVRFDAAGFFHDPAFAGVGVADAGPADAHAQLVAGIAAQHGPVLDQRRAAPSRAEAIAAQHPAAPAPTTTTSNSPSAAGSNDTPLSRLRSCCNALRSSRRHIRQIAGQQQRVAAAKVARQVVQRQLDRPRRQIELAGGLPDPSLVVRGSEDLRRADAVDRDAELSRRMLSDPILGADPQTITARLRQLHLGRRVGDGPSHARGDQVGRPHLLDELGVQPPVAIVGKILGLDPQKAGNDHRRGPWRLAKQRIG